jgi:hypothetical protein
MDGSGRDRDGGPPVTEKSPPARQGLAQRTPLFPAAALEVPASDEAAAGVALVTRARQVTGDGALRAFTKYKSLVVPSLSIMFATQCSAQTD